ncbi:MAG TPA: hypothetical protein VGR20_03945, partial [Acidimicrobiia bacterium]|nr:hypothetical protein [Acidimicrobiia bacterium]
LAAAAKKTVDSARKPVAAMADEELAALAEVEARATELIEAADTERTDAERALAAARGRAKPAFVTPPGRPPPTAMGRWPPRWRRRRRP